MAKTLLVGTPGILAWSALALLMLSSLLAAADASSCFGGSCMCIPGTYGNGACFLTPQPQYTPIPADMMTTGSGVVSGSIDTGTSTIQSGAGANGNGQSAAAISSFSGTYSIETIPLPTRYNDIWDGKWASGPLTHDYLFSGTYYSTDLHQSTSAFGTTAWNEDEEDKRVCVPYEYLSDEGGRGIANNGLATMLAAQKSIFDSKIAYKNETDYFSRMSRQVVMTSSVSDPFEHYPLDGEYMSAWKNSIRASTKTINQTATALNDAFALDQSISDKLHDMGAGEPGYQGDARIPYLQWQAFVNQSGRWSQTPIDETMPADPAKKYGKVRQTLLQLQGESLETGWSTPPFEDLKDELPYTFNLMAGPCADNSLWNVAWRQYENLSDAKAAMLDEEASNQSAALAAKQSAESSIKDMNANNPGAFDTAYASTSEFQRGAVPVMVSGTVRQRAERIGQSGQDAQTLYDSGAAQAGNTGRQGYVAHAIAYYQRSVENYTMVDEQAQSLIAEMEGMKEQAHTDATARVALLRSKLDAASADPSAASALAGTSAKQFLDDAQKELDAGDTVVDSSGNAYAHYAKAANTADKGLNALNNPDAARYKADLMPVLSEYRRLLDTDKALLGDRYDIFEKNYKYYDSLKDNPTAQTLAGARQALADLKTALRDALGKQKSRYEGLQANVSALAGYDSGLQGRFDSDFADYWKDGWTDKALSDWSDLDPLLKKWEGIVEKTYPLAINASLCHEAQWNSALQFALPANVRQETGGTWTAGTSNPFAYHQPLEINCPFGLKFLTADETDHSPNVESASASDHQIRLSLSGVDPNNATRVSFGAMQTPFRMARSWCLDSVDAQHNAQYTANYSVEADYPVMNLPLNIPWTSGADGTAVASIDGQSINGQFVQAPDGTGAVQFVVPWLKDGTYALQATIKPDQAVGMNKDQIVIQAKDGGQVATSYRLTASNLPPCNALKMALSDDTNASSQTPTVASLDGKRAKLADPDATGIWTVRVDSPDDFDSALLKVSYTITDAGAWIAQSTRALEARALALNDTVALGFISDSKAYAANGDYTDADSLLEKARNRLGAQALNNGQALKDWQVEQQAAENLVANLSNLSLDTLANASSPKWQKDLSGWAQTLGTALVKAEEDASGGDITAARTRWRGAHAQVQAKVRLDGMDEFGALSARLDSLRANAKRPELLDGAPDLSAVADDLAGARDAIAKNDAAGALDALLHARQTLERQEAGAMGKAQAAMAGLTDRARALASDAGVLKGALESYAANLSTPDATAARSISPPLSATAARALEKDVDKAATLTLAGGAPPKSYSEAWATVDAQAKRYDEANKSYSDAKAKLDAANAALENGARTAAREAELRVQQALLASGIPQEAADSLQADLAHAHDLLDQGQWVEAAALCENITKRALKYGPDASPQPPYLLIGSSGLLIAGIAYLAFFRKPKNGEGKDGAEKTGNGFGILPSSPGAKPVQKLSKEESLRTEESPPLEPEKGKAQKEGKREEAKMPE
ncbi:MAG: hypothetical protein V1728_01730 [Candidatus Micrarchaeota archaeon]